MAQILVAIKIALLAIAIGIAAAWLWVPLLRDVPEPLPDRLVKRSRLIDSPAHAGEWCESEQDNDCFEGAKKGHLYIVSSEEAK